MTSQQYMNYVADWNTFNTVWSVNYTASTINSGEFYRFSTNDEYLSFLRGQSAHINAYPSAIQQFVLPK